MKKNLLTVLLVFTFIFRTEAQTISRDEQAAAELRNSPLIKYSRNIMLNSNDNKVARNLMIVNEVASFKMGDEKLNKNFENLKDSKTYNQKMDKIFAKLNNNKIRNQKNQQVINILNEAGQKIYNLLVD